MSMDGFHVATTFGAGLLLWVVWQRRRTSYMASWAACWFFLAGASFARILVTKLADSVSVATVAAAGSVLALLHASSLLAGLFGLTHQRPPRSDLMRSVQGAAALVGGLLAFATSAKISVRAESFIASAAALVGLWWMARKRLSVTTPGLLVFSAALLAFAGTRLESAIVGDSSSLWYALAPVLVSVCMVTALLDDEREAAELAASEVEHLAYYDSLTGLPNRSLFFDRAIVAVAEATRHGEGVGLIFLDLDRFKHVNDSLGHSAGDFVLKAATEKIRRTLRTEDTVARFGGDEIAILIGRLERPENVAIVVDKILRAVRTPMLFGEREIFITASIGVSIFPADGEDAETLVRNADAAMYRAKAAGGDSFQFYTDGLDTQALERLEIECGLRRALELNEVQIDYQPIVTADGTTVTGFEALLRWHSRRWGLIEPERFIPTAEASGAIVPIGNWAMRQACTNTRRLQLELNEPYMLSVNLCARQLQLPTLVADVRAALAESGLPAASLCLEVTESSAIIDLVRTINALSALRDLGVRVAVDDFGTGYSSLSYLKSLPIHTLKLDRSFVREIREQRGGTIASSVIDMAHRLGMEVTAEGVETEAQWRFLEANGCDSMQGFLFSMPLPASELVTYLEGTKSRRPGHAARLALPRIGAVRAPESQ